MEAEIKKIVLKVDKKEIELTPKQAKKLHELLDEMYGTTLRREYTPIPYPVVIRDYRPYWDWATSQWESTTVGGNVMYSASNSTAQISL